MTDIVPIISVCIANYNGMDVIDDCLRSVLAQEGQIPVEILVHDDASIDGSAAYVRDHYPEVKLTVSERNVGFCVANNRMAAQAKGRYLLLLNNDAALFPDGIQALLKEASRWGKPAILTLPQFDATSGALVDRGCLLDPFFNPVPNLNPTRQDVAMVIGACFWIPKRLWDEMEGFPAWFDSIAEDMYLCCRARLAGYAVRALNTSGYKHWQGKSFGGNKPVDGVLISTFRRRSLSERNKTFVMTVTCPTPIMQVWLPFHLLLLLVEGALLALFALRLDYLQRIYFPAIGDVVRNRQNWLTARHRAMAGRRCSTSAFFSTFSVMPHKVRMFWRHGLPRVR